MKKFRALLFSFCILASALSYSQCAIFTPSMSITQFNPGSPPFGEDVTKAIDGNVYTKYLNFNRSNTGLIVNTARTSIATRMDLTTANDFPERDPINYTIEGSNNGTSWTSIASGSIPCNNTRFLSRSFTFSNSTSYSWYRVIFPNICNFGLANSMQIAEIQLYQTSTTTPAVSIAASANNICQGTSVTFTPTPTNGGLTPTYQWRVNGVNVATGNTYTSTSLAQGNTVSCVMTSNASCLTTTTATSNNVAMTVNARVTPTHSIINEEPVTNVCQGTTLFFTALSRNGGTPTYQWKVNGVNVGNNSPFIFYNPSNLRNNDVVSCTMTSTLSCVTTNTVNSNTIQVGLISKVTPSVFISGNPSVDRKTPSTFTAVPTNGGSPSYQWYKNGVLKSSSPSFTDTAWNKGTDTIKVRMTSSLTCVTTDSAWSTFYLTVLSLKDIKYRLYLDTLHLEFVKEKEDMVNLFSFDAKTGKSDLIVSTSDKTVAIKHISKYYYIVSEEVGKMIGPFPLISDDPKRYIISTKQLLGQYTQ